MDPARVFAALPDAALGVAFLITWFAPAALGEGMLRYALLTMLLEFIVIHSAAFMGNVAMGDAARNRKLQTMAGLAAFYSLFLIGFSWAQGEWWPMWAFWGLAANRMAGVILTAQPAGPAKQEIMNGWATSMGLFVVWGASMAFLPVPRFGIDEAAVAAADIGGEGDLVHHPYRMIAAGVGYYFSQAWVEMRRKQKRSA